MTTAFAPRLDFARYTDEIARQAAMLRGHLADADLTVPVPSCPGWNLAQLTQHVGEEFRWLEGMVRTRADTMADDTAMRDLSPRTARDTAATGDWIVAGADQLAAALREAGPSARMWTPLQDGGVGFFAPALPTRPSSTARTPR